MPSFELLARLAPACRLPVMSFGEHHHQTPQHHPFNQPSHITEETFENNTARLISRPTSRQQQVQHGRQILLLAHHLLAQVCLDSCEHGMNRANALTAASWCRLVRTLEFNNPFHNLTCSPEYALNAVNQGVTSLGIKAANGIVLATEKKSSTPLIDASSSSKVSLITPNIGMVYSGMGPDYRVLVDKARKVSHTNYKRIYNEYPPTRILVQDVARVMQEATQSGGVRPYGVSLLVAGWDDGVLPEQAEADEEGEQEVGVSGEKLKKTRKTGGIMKGGPSLYQVDPSGSYFPWKATAIGKSAASAKTFLEKRYTEGLELEDAVHIALLTLKETIEGEMNGDTVEIGTFMTIDNLLLRMKLTNTSERHRRTSRRRSSRLRGCRGRSRPPFPQAEPSGD